MQCWAVKELLFCFGCPGSCAAFEPQPLTSGTPPRLRKLEGLEFGV